MTSQLERNVISAARALVADWKAGAPISGEDLMRTVAALDAEAAWPSLDELRFAIIATGWPLAGRARASLDRAIRYGAWPDVRTAADVADLSVGDLYDARQAGPYAYRVWADALRLLKLEPAWVAVLGE